jgi:signal transduction histidine kinase/HAMP domain-containing protein
MDNYNRKFSIWQQRLKERADQIIEQKWFNLGLLAKMGTLVSVGLIGMLLIFAFLGITSARQATQQALRERITLARLSASSIDNTLTYINETLAMLANMPDLRNSHTSLGERRAALQNIQIAGHGIQLLNSESKVILSTEQHSHDPNDWLDIDAIQNALQGNKENLSVLILDKPWTVIAVPIFDSESGEVNGAMAIAIDLSMLDPLPVKNNVGLGKTGTLDVIDSDGWVLFSSQPERMMERDQSEAVRRRLFQAAESGVETCLGCTEEQLPDSSDEVIAFSPLTQAPWGVVIRQEADEVFSPMRHLMVQNLILGSLAIIGALVMVWVTTNSVIVPVQSLTEAAKRIAEGDFSTPTPQLNELWPFNRTQRRDEIGALAESFSTMRNRLKTSIEEIQAWNQELDSRVHIRTEQARNAQFEAQAARDDLRAIIDAISDELIVIGVEDHRVHLSNKAAKKIHPEIEEISDPFCYDILHLGQPCQAPACECPLPAVVESGDSIKVNQIRNGDNKKGIRFLDIVASPMYDAQGNITRIVELTRDVTEEKRIKDSLVRKNEQLAILNAVATTVNQSLDLEIILGHALEQVLHLTGIDVGAIFLLDENLGSLDLLAYRGLSEEAAWLASQLGLLDGACGGVIERGEIVVVPDINRFRGPRAKSLKKERLRTLVHVPLIAKGCTLGSMCVATRQKRDFGYEEEELLAAIGSQIAVAIENARLYSEVQHKERIRGELFEKAINAQEDERKRIARDLHDDTSQSLTALLFALEDSLEMESIKDVKERLCAMRDLTQHMLDGIHKIIFDLRPSMLDHLGLIPALRWFAESRLEPKGIRVSIENNNFENRLPPETETALFRVIQEAIMNISRHAGARNVSISLSQEKNTLKVHVEDDGIGFDMGQLAISVDTSRGLGLLGMEERLELLGGNLEINTMPGFGTNLEITVPIPERIVEHG